MPDVQHVKIADREYDCAECKRPHRYHDEDGLYHRHWQGSFRRWILEIVER